MEASEIKVFEKKEACASVDAATVARAFALKSCAACNGAGLNTLGFPCWICVVRYERDDQAAPHETLRGERDKAIEDARWLRTHAEGLTNEVASLTDEIKRVRAGWSQELALHAAYVDKVEAYKIDAAAQLALEREHVDRLKLALAEARGAAPPPGILERAAIRADTGVRSAWRRFGALVRDVVARTAGIRRGSRRVVRFVVDWLPLALVALGLVSLVLAVVFPHGGRTVESSVPSRTPHVGEASNSTAWVGSVEDLKLGSSSSTTPIHSWSLGTAAPWGFSFSGRRDDVRVCKRCGHALSTRGDQYSDEVAIELPVGHVVFDGCVWCLAADAERVRRLAPAPHGGITIGTYSVSAGTVFVVDEPIEGLAFVSSGAASVMIERRGR